MIIIKIEIIVGAKFPKKFLIEIPQIFQSKFKNNKALKF